MNHFKCQDLQSLLRTVIVVAGAFLLNACSPNLPGSDLEGAVVGLNLPNEAAVKQPATLKLEVQIRRAGFDGRVQLDLQDLPEGASANSVSLEPNQDLASFMVTGLANSSAKATVRLRFGNLELSRPLALSEAKPVLELPGGTHTQTVRNINGNLDSSGFVTHQVYANFKGSTCQVMVRALNAGLYVCFNEAIQAGKTYNLITARDSIPGTASITYFQAPAASPSRQALWDSVSGSLKVLSVSKSNIEFSISAAKFSPAKGFGKNLASGEFVLEAATTVTDISNLP
jgi:hypothetical protein